MKKTIAVAALVAATFAAAPVIPAQAASYPAHCLVLPLLQADCRAVIRENIGETAAAARSAAKVRKIELPVIGGCERAPAGSGHLYDC